MSAAQFDAIRKLKRMVAGSSTFQTRCQLNEHNVDERIYTPGKLFDPWQGDRPVFPTACIVVPDGGFPNYSAISGGGSQQYSTNGVLQLQVWDVERYRGDPTAGYEDAVAFCGGVIEDVLSLSSVDDHLEIIAAESVEEPTLLKDSVPDGERYQILAYNLTWRNCFLGNC